MWADQPSADGPVADGPQALLYFGLYLASSPDPTAAQIVAGTDGAGAPLIASGSATPPTTSGDFAWPTLITGLTPGTAYRASWVWVEGATKSNVFATNVSTVSLGEGGFGGRAVLVMRDDFVFVTADPFVIVTAD